mgnify:CR=1 FL=1
MSSRYPQGRRPSREQETVTISLDTEPMEIVETVLKNHRSYFYRELKSGTSYRKIHELLAGILDSAEGMKDPWNFLKLQLPRAYVIIEYQRARDQIGEGLKSILIKVIEELTEKANTNDSRIKEAIRKARLLLDSIAVIAKEKE